ncbi:8483_t:CDS:2 [Entrophospora sp. SA101]|nr:8483_t:CDS:2 [Entrophospora sp. SA101]
MNLHEELKILKKCHEEDLISEDEFTEMRSLLMNKYKEAFKTAEKQPPPNNYIDGILAGKKLLEGPKPSQIKSLPNLPRTEVESFWQKIKSDYIIIIQEQIIVGKRRGSG